MSNPGEFPLLASFIAGILTFVSPCVLPLIPAYLSFITGASLDELKAGGNPFRHTFFNALFFVLGFSAVFVLLGASASFLGSLLFEKKEFLRYAGGAVVILFGLHVAGVIRIPFLYHEKKMKIGKLHLGHAGPFLIGIAFAVGWTPCVGPILSSLLILASTQETVYRGILLLSVYSLGMGIPFLLTALFINGTLRLFSRVKKYYRFIEVFSGAVLVAVGLLLITDSFKLVSGFFTGIFG
ncbi:MAG: cytochrome c biogenesis CcdA family protein [Endomicrobiales bacterium]